MLAAYAIANLFVFDTLQTYVLVFGVLAFSDYLADRAPVDDELPEEPPAPGRTKGQLVVAAVAAAVVAVVPLTYALSVRPMLAARELAAGVDAWTVGRPVPEMQQHFERALAYGSFTRPEAGDWIAKLVPDVIRGRGRGTREQIDGFVGVAIRELHALTVAPAADVKHFVVLGDVYTRAAKLDASYAARAVEVLTRALARWPMNPKIYFELATAHEVAGDGARAIATMQAVVALVPDYPEAQLRLALTAWRAGRRDLAESAISRFQSLRIRPERESAQLYRRLAALLRDMGDRAGAVVAARKVVELDPRLRSAADEFIREMEGPPRPR
jgi:tetratricopeptide (TPR) repeat protein